MILKEPKISVIVPMYNAEKCVGFCLESIFNQTFKDYEIILIDDASKDGTYDICQKMREKHPAMTLMRNSENKGQWYSRNKGVEAAKGKYIYFMDSDDEILQEALAVFYEKAEEENADVVHTNIYFDSYAEGRMSSRLSMWELCRGRDMSEGLFQGSRSERLQTLFRSKQPMPWLKLIRRNLLFEKGIKFRPLTISEDDVFSAELALKSERFVCINMPLYIYRKYYNEKDRVVRRLPKALSLMAKVVGEFNELFGQFPVEELPFSQRQATLSGWLIAHLNFWIYDILDTDKEHDFSVLEKVFCPTALEIGLRGELIPLFLHLLANEANLRVVSERKKEQQRKKLTKRLEGMSEEGRGDYSLVYSLAKRATLLEGGGEAYYLMAYRYLAWAAFHLGHYREAWDAYGKAMIYVTDEVQKEQLRVARRAVQSYLELDEDIVRLKETGRKGRATDESSKIPSSEVVFGVCARYFDIIDDMLCLWREIMEEVPSASLVIISEDFAARPMMVEAAERFLAKGFDPERVKFVPASPEWYRGLDIFLDTYPASQGEKLKEALSHGVASVSLWDGKQESRAGGEILSSVGLGELVSSNADDYVAKAVSLGCDPDFLNLLAVAIAKSSIITPHFNLFGE